LSSNDETPFDFRDVARQALLFRHRCHFTQSSGLLKASSVLTTQVAFEQMSKST
jgi:hypothetical protein